MDEKALDRAEAWQESALQDEIQDARKHLRQSPKPKGTCLYCEEVVDDNRRFCDRYCAADAEKYGTADGGYIPIDKNRRIKNGKRPKYLT